VASSNNNFHLLDYLFTKFNLSVEDKYYQEAIDKNNYKYLNFLFNLENNSPDTQLNRILQYNLLDYAVRSNDKEFVKKNYRIWNFFIQKYC